MTALVAEAHARYKIQQRRREFAGLPGPGRGAVELFGICVVSTSGSVYAAGDTDYEFSIMSVSKPFVFAMVCQC